MLTPRIAAIEGVDVIDMMFEEDDELDLDPPLLLCFSSDVGLGLRILSNESNAPPTPLPPEDPALFKGMSEFCSRILFGI